MGQTLRRVMCYFCLWPLKELHFNASSAKDFLSAHLPSVPFHEEGWRYILKEHGGKLPIRVKAVPEGYSLPVKNILFSVENTDPKCYWLVGYLETILVQV